jgi:diaminopimelate epimerase
MQLTKHHGLGNDFLVLIDLDDATPIDADLARHVCDRRRGIGADGLMRVSPGTDGADVTMTLRNRDGSPAEMSGNGIRCLGQAVAMHRGVDRLELSVATAGGRRHLSIVPGAAPRTADVRVDMGVVGEGSAASSEVSGWTSYAPPPAGAAGHGSVPPGADNWVKSASLDLGNPHLVLLVDDPYEVPVEIGGPWQEARYPDGINVEWIAPTPGEADALTLRVWERGAGVTEACGTGACAAAHAAREWGIVGDHVTVHMPGGDVEVLLGATPADPVTLVGPATHIATIEVPWP